MGTFAEYFKLPPGKPQADEDIAADLYWDLDGIANKVWDERKRQIAKWGLQHRPDGTNPRGWEFALLNARATYERNLVNGELTWVDILREEVFEAFAAPNTENLKEELVQVMAVAASWLQDLELSE